MKTGIKIKVPSLVLGADGDADVVTRLGAGALLGKGEQSKFEMCSPFLSSTATHQDDHAVSLAGNLALARLEPVAVVCGVGRVGPDAAVKEVSDGLGILGRRQRVADGTAVLLGLRIVATVVCGE